VFYLLLYSLALRSLLLPTIKLQKYTIEIEKRFSKYKTFLLYFLIFYLIYRYGKHTLTLLTFSSRYQFLCTFLLL